MAYADVAASTAKASNDQLAQTINAGTTFNFGGSGKGDSYDTELGQTAKADASASASLGGNAASAIGGVPITTWLEIGAVVLILAGATYFYLHHKK